MDFVLKSRNTIAAILAGKDPRLLLIVGPCSIHDPAAIFDYAVRLKELSEKLEETFFFVMRAYFEKPRTCHGWKGFLHDPFLDGSHCIDQSLSLTRKLLRSLIGIKIPLAAEFLDPAAPHYLGDLISWGCVGARTVSSPIHRQMASHLDMPIAFKNSIDGTLESALWGIEVAKVPHTFMGMNREGRLARVRSKGNPYTHLVLRGGDKGPNYESPFIDDTLKRTPCLLVDCAHGNSKKEARGQLHVFEKVLSQVALGNRGIRGMMLESFLYEGNQSLASPLVYGVSITDPCLDFEATEDLLLKGAARLQLCAI